MGFARGLGVFRRLRAVGAFLSGQKGTKEPSKERGISISPSPLKFSPLETTKRGLRPPLWNSPGGRAGTYPVGRGHTWAAR